MKIGLISLGCPKNLVDSEVMLGLAERAGHEITGEATEADVLVVNTCAFIDSAKQESINTILEMAQHKIDGRARRLVVTGCLAERYREELRTQIPEIDAILGTGEVDRIVGAIDGQPAAPATLSLFRRGADGSAETLGQRPAASAPRKASRVPLRRPKARGRRPIAPRRDIVTPRYSPPTCTTRPRRAGSPRPATMRT